MEPLCRSILGVAVDCLGYGVTEDAMRELAALQRCALSSDCLVRDACWSELDEAWRVRLEALTRDRRRAH